MSKIGWAGYLAAEVGNIKEDVRYVLNEAVQDVIEGAQTPQAPVAQTGGSFETGKIAVDTAELINSLHLDEQHIGDSPEVVGLIEPGTIQTFEWQAPHAAAHEFGFRIASDEDTDYGGDVDVPGRFFATENAAKFGERVDHHAKALKK